jgi:methionine-rich copper-binding protein CopC
MTLSKNLAILSIGLLLSPLSVLARDKNQHSVNIFSLVQVGDKQLRPGNYKVEWQGTGPKVEVSFVREGKTVATVPAMLKLNDSQATQDDVITKTISVNEQALEELDFAHQKEALLFGQSGS